MPTTMKPIANDSTVGGSGEEVGDDVLEDVEVGDDVMEDVDVTSHASSKAQARQTPSFSRRNSQKIGSRHQGMMSLVSMMIWMKIPFGFT